MAFSIRRAAVIGAGTMGGGIAALLAGVGIETVLLDIPAHNTIPGDSPRKRNTIVNDGLKRLRTSRPAQLFAESDLDKIRVGNLEDDMDILADADWVIEAVLEKLEIKQDLINKIAQAVRPDCIISTNTSGIPLKLIAEHQNYSFRKRFLGTHFFNPPRYLYLLEIIPHAETESQVIDFMTTFGAHRLGKGVVLCKDTPNFIANRISSFSGSFIRNTVIERGLRVEDVDALTGPLIGRPRTATFRLQDLVGFDTSRFVVQNLYAAVPHDPMREILNHPKTNALADKMITNNWLGNKTGQGFYKPVKTADGKREFWALDLDTYEYKPPQLTSYDSVEKYATVKDTGERIRMLISEPDRAGRFLWDIHAFDLTYASNCIPEITDSVMNLDNAVKWGFNREMGPFEIWDAIGVGETIQQFEEAGYKVAGWVKEMVGKGHPTFYQYDKQKQIIGYFDLSHKHYVAIKPNPYQVTANALRAAGKEIMRNDSASILEMGDGIALLELHSEHNLIDQQIVDLTREAVDLLEREFDGLVIGCDAQDFCVGVNTAGALDAMENLIKDGQAVIRALRHASKPVVTTVAGKASGVGAAWMMAGDCIVSHMELRAGFETHGSLPIWGGCKEIIRRIVNPVMKSSPNADPIPHLQKVFENILLSKLSGSASEAQQMGFLSASDRIVMNRAYLLGEAKRAALTRARDYHRQNDRKVWAAGQAAYAELLLAAENLVRSGHITAQDQFIAEKLAYVLSGGALTAPQWVAEEFILDLETAVLSRLLREPNDGYGF